jgi:hypothetical protein
MSGLEIRWTDASGLLKQMGALAKLTPGQVAQAGSRGLNHTGSKARTQTKKALTKQTGLKSKVINKALKPLGMTAKQKRYRNIGTIAHVDTGKTALTAAVLMMQNMQEAMAVPTEELGPEKPSASWPEMADAAIKRKK